MAVIQNQQTDLLKYLSLNNTEITVGSGRISSSEVLNVNDIETASGRIRRYNRQNKRSVSVSYEYIPSNSDKTVDGREGRDFLFNLATNAPRVLVSYKDDPTGASNEYYGFINSYSESIVRRDIPAQCTYYQVSFEIEEQ
jgi:hypothetical protein